jgi:hypothetical protein
MKKLIAIALVMMLALILLSACGVSSDKPRSSNNAASGNTSSTQGGEDPCDCCPDCNQEECECTECGDSSDCKCKLPGGLAPALTYDIVIDVEILCPIHADSADPGIVSNGTARVTMNFIDSKTGYLGSSSDGAGETIANHMCDLEPVYYIPGDLRSYEFTAQLSISGDQKTILVGLDRLGPDELFYNYSIWEGLEDGTSQSVFSFFFQEMMGDHFVPPEYGLVVYPDLETGLLVFEVPLIEGEDMQGQQFKWGDNIFISITLTPVP